MVFWSMSTLRKGGWLSRVHRWERGAKRAAARSHGIVAAADQAADTDEGYLVDTTGGAVNITLPIGTVGDRVAFKDYEQNFDTNALTITPDTGQSIEGQTAPLVIDNQGWGGVLEYVDQQLKAGCW